MVTAAVSASLAIRVVTVGDRATRVEHFLGHRFVLMWEGACHRLDLTTHKIVPGPYTVKYK